MRHSLLAGVALLCASLSAPAWADISVVSGPLPGNPEENVLLDGGVLDNTVIGTTNQTGTEVLLVGDENLITPSSGQARVKAEVGTFDYLTISLADLGLGFTEFEFNLRPRESGTVQVLAFDQFGGSFGGTFNVGATGGNWFNAFATNNQLITGIQLTSDVQLRNASHFRLGGVAPIGVIPEPATWAMMLLGFFGVGGMLRETNARRRQTGPAFS